MFDIKKIKRRLGIEDDLQDELIIDLVADASAIFMTITKSSFIPGKYTFMIEDVAYKLYNRKGSEGITSESIDGYTAQYSSGLYDDYMDILVRDFNLDDDGSERKAGRVMFY